MGQVAKLLAARAEVRLTRAFGLGTVRQGRCRRERGVEVTVREQQGRRMKHDNGEGEMERYDMRTANTSSHARSCQYVTQGKCKQNVRATRSVCTHLAQRTPCHPQSKSQRTASSHGKLHHNLHTFSLMTCLVL